MPFSVRSAAAEHSFPLVTVGTTEVINEAAADAGRAGFVRELMPPRD